MKTLLRLFIIVGLFTTTISAFSKELQPIGSFDLYVVDMNDLKDHMMEISFDFKTTDGCNSFSLVGDLVTLHPESALYMGSHQIIQTEISCPNGAERSIHLETKLPDIYEPKVQSAILMLPEGMKLNLTERSSI